MSATVHKLGEFIEEVLERNIERRYGENDLLGVNNEQSFCHSRANTVGIDFRPYKVVRRNDFVYNPARLDIGSIARFEGEACIVSTLYEVFRIKPDKQDVLLPEYLQVYFARKEFARYVGFKNWGSAREYFWLDAMMRTPVPVPPLAEQREAVAVWQGLRKMKEENEQLAVPLMQLCRSYLEQCKKKWPLVELSGMIEERNERNAEGTLGASDCEGVTSVGEFDESRATLDGIDFSKYKVIQRGVFAYNPSRINLGSIALNKEIPCIVSPMYIAFQVNDKKLLPEFLELWFRRSEFQRSTLFFASGSVRDTFSFTEMCRVRVPLPPLEVQQAIVDVYRCASEAKKIAAEADRLSRDICPALVVKTAKSGE